MTDALREERVARLLKAVQRRGEELIDIDVKTALALIEDWKRLHAQESALRCRVADWTESYRRLSDKTEALERENEALRKVVDAAESRCCGKHGCPKPAR